MTSVADLIADMVRAGVDPDLIGRTAAALSEREPVKIIDEQADRRRTKDRERKRLRNSAESAESVEVSPPSSPVPLAPPSQTLPPIIPQTPSPTPETKRGTRLSADWVLPASWGRWAVDQGFAEATIRLEADKFRDFWCSKSGKDATKLDWEATWRNWTRNSAPRSRTTGPPAQKPKSDFMQHQDDVQAELDRALGKPRNDKFSGNTFDLGSGDYRSFSTPQSS